MYVCLQYTIRSFLYQHKKQLRILGISTLDLSYIIFNLICKFFFLVINLFPTQHKIHPHPPQIILYVQEVLTHGAKLMVHSVPSFFALCMEGVS